MTRLRKGHTLPLVAGSLLAASLLVPAGGSPAEGSGSISTLANARITVRSASGGLERALGSAAADTDWIGWTVPRVDDGSLACCSDGVEAENRKACRLDAHGIVYHGSDPPAWLRPTGDLRILVQWRDGRPGDVVAFAESCPLDAMGQTVLWLEDVDPRGSVALLEGLATRRAGSRSGHHGALGALARHDVPAANDALARLAAPGHDRDLRQGAIFWLGHSRDRAGFAALDDLLERDDVPEIRSHIAFALTQSPVPESVDRLARMAREEEHPEVREKALFWLAHSEDPRAEEILLLAVREDPSPSVRKHAVFALTQLPDGRGVPHLVRLTTEADEREIRRQAIFWLAQSEDPRAPAILLRALREDPDPDVREHAVFALTQLPDEGTEELIQVARTSQDPEVRKKALFWLGQSDDPRAMEFFEEVLRR